MPILISKAEVAKVNAVIAAAAAAAEAEQAPQIQKTDSSLSLVAPAIIIPKAFDETAAQAHVTKMLKRIRVAHDGGNLRRARDLTRQYLVSYDARYVALLRAWGK